MKALKSVFAAFAVFFLAVSLTGCLGDEKTASQSGVDGLSAVSAGSVKLVLTPESKYITIHFPQKNLAEKQRDAILGTLKENNVPIEHFVVSGDSTQGVLFVRTGQIHDEIVMTLQKDDLVSFTVESPFGKVIAMWEPSFGSKVKYIG